MLGRNLGNYGVVSKLGEGGMGVVYLARHATLGRPAAVKVLRSTLSSNQDVVSRFFNEARAATAVRHPGIVEVYDFGFLEDRTAYIIMEYLDGESLAARMRRGRISIAMTLTTVRAIARTLQAVHEHGIIHRDLKPDNVFLIPDEELPSGQRIKILDFGIAKLAPALSSAHNTTTGTVLGTPLYMSPEQCRGAGPVDHRADLYSVGCIAYEMLGGQSPFDAEGPGDVIARHLYFKPSSLRLRREDVPQEVDEIVLRLLRKEPKERYATAADLVRAIDQLAVATPSIAHGDDLVPTLPAIATQTSSTVVETTLTGAASQTEAPRKIAKKHRLLLAAAATGAALALLAIVILIPDHDARGGKVTPPAFDPSSTSPQPKVITADSDLAPEHTGWNRPPAPQQEQAEAVEPRNAFEATPEENPPSSGVAVSFPPGEDLTTPGEAGDPRVRTPSSSEYADRPKRTPVWRKRSDAERPVSTVATPMGATSPTMGATSPTNQDTADAASLPPGEAPETPSEAGNTRERATSASAATSKPASEPSPSTPSKPKPEAREAGLEFSCISPVVSKAGQHLYVRCKVSNHGDISLDLAYKLSIPNVSSSEVPGPDKLGARSQLERFYIDFKMPENAAPGPQQVTVAASKHDAQRPIASSVIHVEVIDADKLCETGKLSAREHQRLVGVFERASKNGSITSTQLKDYRAALDVCSRPR